MFKTKLAVSFVISILFITILSVSSFGLEGFKGDGEVNITSIGVVDDAMASDRPVSNEGMSDRHIEVNSILFEKSIFDLKTKGIQITHTGPDGEMVEVGIQPYTAENAEYVYSLLGTDGVKLVEGMNAELVTITAIDLTVEADNAPTGEFRITARNETDSASLAIYLAAAILMAGAIVFVIVRRKPARS